MGSPDGHKSRRWDPPLFSPFSLSPAATQETPAHVQATDNALCNHDISLISSEESVSYLAVFFFIVTVMFFFFFVAYGFIVLH